MDAITSKVNFPTISRSIWEIPFSVTPYKYYEPRQFVWGAHFIALSDSRPFIKWSDFSGSPGRTSRCVSEHLFIGDIFDSWPHQSLLWSCRDFTLYAIWTQISQQTFFAETEWRSPIWERFRWLTFLENAFNWNRMHIRPSGRKEQLEKLLKAETTSIKRIIVIVAKTFPTR